MNSHILLPEADLSRLQMMPCHEEWLTDWFKKTEADLENGIVSTSLCLQGMLTETVLYGRCKRDWVEMLQSYLVDEAGEPLAYSEEYGKKLFGFNQWKQTTVHAVHTHWWIRRRLGANDRELVHYGDLVSRFIQPSGWIYNPQVSNTGVRTRMRSELMMSVAMGVEILSCHGSLECYGTLCEGLLASEPITYYLSAEYFRMRALGYLDAERLAPVEIPATICMCEAGEGYCDFSLQGKVDDYMGSAKRAGRDKASHSAILSLYARYLAEKCGQDVRLAVVDRLGRLASHLKSTPLDIQAFRMRDIEVPFGTDISPLEVMAASFLVSIAEKQNA